MHFTPALALLALTVSANAQQTWVVDAALGGGADFDQIQPAVDAAAPGDVVLVRAGTYTEFDVVGKGLVVVAEAGAEPLVTSVDGIGFANGVQIRDLPAGQTTVLRGLWLTGTYAPPYTFGDTLSVRQCAGSVLIEDCRIYGPSVDVIDSGAVAFVRCTVVGQDGFSHPDFSYPPTTALVVQSSNVYAFASSFDGGPGDGGFSGITWAQVGAAGIKISDRAQLYLDGCRVQGGDGGDVMPGYYSCSTPGHGGPGLWLGTGSPSAALRATTLAGGAGGAVPSHCTPSSAGAPSFVQSGAISTYADGGPLLVTSTPVREGQVMNVTLTSNPGDLGFVLFASSFELQPLPLFASPLAVPPSATVLAIATFPASGQIVAQPVVANLPIGVEGALYALQIAACDLGAGACLLGNASAAIGLDASF